jgi:hypothetical protein
MSGGRHTLATGSHHQPLSHIGGGGTAGGRHTLATGSDQPLPQSSGCAEPSPDVQTAKAVNEASAAPTTAARRRTNFLMPPSSPNG